MTMVFLRHSTVLFRAMQWFIVYYCSPSSSSFKCMLLYCMYKPGRVFVALQKVTYMQFQTAQNINSIKIAFEGLILNCLFHSFIFENWYGSLWIKRGISSFVLGTHNRTSSNWIWCFVDNSRFRGDGMSRNGRRNAYFPISTPNGINMSDDIIIIVSYHIISCMCVVWKIALYAVAIRAAGIRKRHRTKKYCHQWRSMALAHRWAIRKKEKKSFVPKIPIMSDGFSNEKRMSLLTISISMFSQNGWVWAHSQTDVTTTSKDGY